MKKKSPKMLSLHRETLGNLAAPDLRDAAGAITEAGTCTGICTVSCDRQCQNPFLTAGTACCQ